MKVIEIYVDELPMDRDNIWIGVEDNAAEVKILDSGKDLSVNVFNHPSGPTDIDLDLILTK